jgi:hypothetical protein
LAFGGPFVSLNVQLKNEDPAPKLVPERQSCTLDPVRSGQFVSFNGFAAVPFLAFRGFGLGAALWHSTALLSVPSFGVQSFRFGPARWCSIGLLSVPPFDVQWFGFRWGLLVI